VALFNQISSEILHPKTDAAAEEQASDEHDSDETEDDELTAGTEASRWRRRGWCRGAPVIEEMKTQFDLNKNRKVDASVPQSVDGRKQRR
jgi:hypothetical protein